MIASQSTHRHWCGIAVQSGELYLAARDYTPSQQWAYTPEGRLQSAVDWRSGWCRATSDARRHFRLFATIDRRVRLQLRRHMRPCRSECVWAH